MNARIEQLFGMVLQITPTGEKHSRVTLFTEHFGMQSVLFRKSAKLGLSSQPDLFDDLECTLSYGSISSDMPFIREWKAVGKRTFLARDHKIFFAASDIARFFLLNGSHILETKSLYDLLIKSINGLKNDQPLAVRIKTLFRFAQSEGLPAKQAWLPQLSQSRQKNAKLILNTPLAELSNLPSDAEKILKSLIDWLNAETELKY